MGIRLSGPRGPWVASLVVLAGTALYLHGQGRRWWCACGSWRPFVADIWSRHCSQHGADPYSLAHVLHGVIFFGALWGLRRRIPEGWRFVLALLAEVGWEVFENSDFVIRRYRVRTISKDYAGDTVLNSLSDILSCGLGFWIAGRLGLRRSLILFAAIEVVLLIWIRDSLMLNVLMLIRPVEAIKRWQLGGRG